MNFKSLKILDRFRRLFEKMGIDYHILRKILEVKLTLDTRRVATISINDSKKKEGNEFNKSLLSYGITGLILMVFLYAPMDLFVKMSLIFGIMMFMIMTTMISDFSSVLLDTKDKNILLSKPIDEKTVNTAKVLHVFIYLFIITMTIAAPTLIVGTIKYNLWFFVLFFISLILIDGFIIFLASLLYTIMIKYFDGEKLQDVINNFQILLSLSMVIGYQVLIRMFDFIDLEIVYHPKWWNVLVPPLWFSAPFSLVIDSKSNSLLLLFSLMAVIVPIIALLLHIKVVGPYFEKNILKLQRSNQKNSIFISLKKRFRRVISTIFSFRREEGIFIRFSQNILSNERNLKLRIYPILALSAIFPFIMLMNFFTDMDSIPKLLYEVSQSQSYLSLYLAIFMILQVGIMIKTSDHYKGAWIYKTLPLETPAPIFKGSIKGYLLKYNLPLFLFLNGVSLFLYGPKILLDLIIITLNMVLVSVLLFNASNKALPFSKPFTYIKEDSMITFFLSLIFTGGAFGLHVLSIEIPYGHFIYLSLILLFLFLLWRSLSKIQWKDI